MPLGPPVAREALHERTVRCQGWRRADGLWDVEGHLVDSKTYGFANRDRGGIAAGEPVHKIAVRLTLDDSMTIRAAEAAVDHGPYHACPAAAAGIECLVGVVVGAGFRRAVRAHLGGTAGCEHLRALLDPVARTAYQTIVPLRARSDGEAVPQRPAVIDTCHAWRADGPVVAREHPAFYEGDDPS